MINRDMQLLQNFLQDKTAEELYDWITVFRCLTNAPKKLRLVTRRELLASENPLSIALTNIFTIMDDASFTTQTFMVPLITTIIENDQSYDDYALMHHDHIHLRPHRTLN